MSVEQGAVVSSDTEAVERIDLTARVVLAVLLTPSGPGPTGNAELYAAAAYDYAEALEAERERRHG